MNRAATTQAVRHYQVALVGNPNTGKTTLFNQLCRTNRKTANYPGVTVERHSGGLPLPNLRADLIDLPGTYSLKADSYDEEVVVDSLMGRVSGLNRPDLVVVVLDAGNLRRNLYLYTQLAELGLPLVGALTMTDTLEAGGIQIDVAHLEKSLSIPIIDVSEGKADRRGALLRQIESSLLEQKPAVPARPTFPPALDTIAADLVQALADRSVSLAEARNLLLYRGPVVESVLANDAAALAELERARERARAAGVSAPAVMAAARYRWIENIVAKVERREDRGISISGRLDRIFTHRLLGPPIFAAIMYVVFASIYAWAAPLMEGIEGAFSLAGSAVVAPLAEMPVLSSLIKDGIIGGVGSVVVFLPQIIFLFLFIALLEDSGYLARAALMMDRLLAWTGLNGRAFIPMLSSFACAVPGVMSARVMPDPRARLTTILIAPLMSCSARLPVYVLMIGAFIEPTAGALVAGLALFLMHGVGVVVALPIAFFLNRRVLRTPTVPFVLELPPYRTPHLRSVYYRVRDASMKFLVRSGTIIFALSVVIWSLTYFPRPPAIQTQIESKYAEQIQSAREKDGTAAASLIAKRDSQIAATYLEQSYLGRAGHAIQPLFAPLGYDWKITVGILGAFPAREVIISTLGIIYSVGDPSEESTDLRETMRREKRADGTPVFTPLTAVSIMVFFALCCQCLSTVVTVQRETQSWKWAIFLFVYMTALAYVGSLLVYQGGRAIGFS